MNTSAQQQKQPLQQQMKASVHSLVAAAATLLDLPVSTLVRVITHTHCCGRSLSRRSAEWSCA